MNWPDRYEKINPLGSGPDCDVFRGRSTILNIEVAIKELREEVRLNHKRRERLFSETVVGAQQAHDNLVKIHDIERTQGLIVREFLPQTAADLIRRGPTPPAMAVAILRDCLQGIDCLHRQNLVHANIKPSNLMFDGRGRVKLADGRFLSGDASATLPPPRGTHKYAAPEWMDDAFGDVGPGLDVYALGFVVIELLAGPKFAEFVPPDPIDEEKGWIRWHTSVEDPPLATAQLMPHVPPRLAAVLDRMVARSLRDRSQSVAEILEELKDWDATPPAEVVEDASKPKDVNAPIFPPRPGTLTENPKPPQPANPPGPRNPRAEPIRPENLPTRPASPVVLRIASTERAGEFIGVDASSFTLGGDSQCDVVLSAPAVLNASVVQFARDAEGWKAAPMGGICFINAQLCEAEMLIRSGDLLRLSLGGPDVQFLVQSQNQRRLDQLVKAHTPLPVRPSPAGGRSGGNPRPNRAPAPPDVAPPPPLGARVREAGKQESTPPATPAPSMREKHAAPANPARNKGPALPAPPAAPSAPRPASADSQQLGLADWWHAYYAANKDRANWLIVGAGILVLAGIIALLPGGEETPPSSAPVGGATASSPAPAPPASPPAGNAAAPNGSEEASP